MIHFCERVSKKKKSTHKVTWVFRRGRIFIVIVFIAGEVRVEVGGKRGKELRRLEEE